MKSCSASIPQNVGILTTSALVFQERVGSGRFPIQLRHNIHLFSDNYIADEHNFDTRDNLPHWENSAYAFPFLLIWFSSWRYLCFGRDICAWTEGGDCKRQEDSCAVRTPFGTPRQNAVWVKLAHVLNSDDKFPSERTHCPCRLFLPNKMATTYCSEVQRAADTLPSGQVCFTLNAHNP